MQKFDSSTVLVIGAGPVGLTIALELTRFGVPVRIIDKSLTRTDKSKALVLWSRTLELLGHAAQEFIDNGLPVTHISVLTEENLIGRLDISGVRSPYPFALMIPQSETERLLEGMLNRRGVMVERGVEATSVSQTGDFAQSILLGPDGKEERVRTDWLIGCDGAHSLVRHSVGATFDGETLPSAWVLADVHIDDYPFCTDVSVHWHRSGILVVFPITRERFRIVGNIDNSDISDIENPSMTEIQQLVDQRSGFKCRLSHAEWLTGFRINDRKVKEYRYQRMFLVGDAAHIHSPAGGQGMNTGMQDALNLAWKLALVIKGSCSKELLDSYSIERSHVGDNVLKATSRLTKIATVTSPITQELRNFIAHHLLGISKIQHAIGSAITEVAIHYPISPLNGPKARSGPYPGERFFTAHTQSGLHEPSDERFTLYMSSIPVNKADFHAFQSVLHPNFRQNLDSDTLYLVRADGYVACSSQDQNVIINYLRNISS